MLEIRSNTLNNIFMKKIILSVIFSTFLFTINIKAADFVATQNGNWSNSATWGGAGTPGAGDDVYTNGFEITVTVNATCDNLFISYDKANSIGVNALRNLFIRGTLTCWDDAGGYEEFPVTNVINTTPGGTIVFTGAALSGSPYEPYVIFGWDPDAASFRNVTFNFGAGNEYYIMFGVHSTVSTRIQSGTLYTDMDAMLTGSGSLTIDAGAILDTQEPISDGTTTGYYPTVTINGLLRTNDYVNASTLNIGAAGVLLTSFSGGNQTEGWWYQSTSPNTFNLNATSTINFSANNNQNVPPLTYGHLTLSASSGTRTKTLAGVGTPHVLGNLTISSANTVFASTNNDNFIIEGNITNNGTWITSATQPITLNGIALRTIGGNNNTVFNSEVIIQNPFGVNLNRDITCNSNLVLDPGAILNANARTITFAADFEVEGTFNPGTGTVIFNGNSNITGNVNPIFNHLTINATRTLNNPGNLTLRGNFTNNGTFVHNNSIITFTGNSAQNISGSTVTDFYNIIINKASGTVTVNSSQNLLNEISLTDAGAGFNANGNLTLISTLTRTARIAELPTPANFTGNITMQKLAPGGLTGWALLGSPISGATINDWRDDFTMSGFTGSHYPSVSFNSMFRYDENINGLPDDKYVAASNVTDLLGIGRGWWVYLGDGTTNTNDIMIDVSGPINRGSVSMPVAYNSIGNPEPDDRGWNLIANPYPSAISWAALRNGNSDINATYYVHNADYPDNEQFVTYNAGTEISVPNDPAYNVGDLISAYQGFYIKLDAATTLTATESNKRSGNPALRNSRNSDSKFFRLNLSNANSTKKDQAVVCLHPDATNGYDSEYDSYKMATDEGTLQICTFIGNSQFTINTFSENSGALSIPLRVKVPVNGNYSVSVPDFDDFPLNSCIILEDTYNGEIIDLRTVNSYSFAAYDTTELPRFIVHISSPTIIQKEVFNATCNNISNAYIVASANSSGPFDYIWKDNTGAVIKTTTGILTADTLDNIGAGVYSVSINDGSNCGASTETFIITEPDAVSASFTFDSDTIDISVSGSVSFFNTSQESSDFTWDFGDGSYSTLQNPNHTYTATGTYTVMMIANNNLCSTSDTAYAVIYVTDITTGIEKIVSDNEINILNNRDGVFITFNFEQESDAVVNVYNVAGQKMVHSENLKATTQTVRLDIPVKHRLYLVQVSTAEKVRTFKIIR
jgi:PKD repeat protein